MKESAKQAIQNMAQGSYDYIQFKIGLFEFVFFNRFLNNFVLVDIEEEKIELVTAEKLSIEKLPSKVPDNSARYHLFKFKHTHEGDYMENIGQFSSINLNNN